MSEPKVNILLVDDLPANLLALRAILEDLGQNLVEAQSGDDALRRLLEEDFAVILLDVQMEDLDGFETARLIRSREKSRLSPIIFLTAYEVNRLTLEEAYALGAVDYLVKPLVPTILRAKVAGFVELFQKTEKIKRQAYQLRQMEREAFERQQTEAKNRFVTVLSSIGDAVIVTDAQGRVSFMNPFAQQLTGWNEEAIGADLPEVVRILDEASDQPAENPFARVMREGAIVAHDGVLIRKDQTRVPIDNNGAPIRDLFGSIDGVVLILRDVSARKLAEGALREAGERFRSVVDHVIDGIVTIDERGTVESFNLAAERLFGYTAADVIGQNVKLLMPEPYHSEHDNYIARYLETGRAKIIGIGREVVAQRKDGQTFPIELAVSTFQRNDRRYFTGIIRDISGRKRLEEELRERAEQLLQDDRRKNEFLAMLSHELRNPLAPIRHAAQILTLLEKSPDPEVRWAQEVISRQVRQLTRLVDDLLDVARIKRGKIKLKKEAVELITVVARAVEMALPHIDSRRHELTVAHPPDPLWLDADPFRLTQVIANLLNNAAKYTAEGGQIWLTVERQREQAVLKVRDSGIGIQADFLPHVFDLFTQKDQSLERTQGGLGIGLTLVRNLVEMHGGTVRAMSGGIGKGSEFVVHLPLMQKPAPRVAPVSAAAPTTQPPARQILVVDDNRDSAHSLAKLLRLHGHDVRTAYDGPQALEAARIQEPEIILLDIGLPGMDGLDVARRVRQELHLTNVVLVALTGYGQEEDRRRSQEAGFNAHLVKPVDLDALREILARPEFTRSAVDVPK